MNIKHLLESTVGRYPNRTALIFENRQWSYTELYYRIKRFAHALSNLGVRPTDRVAFYVTTSEQSVTTYFACQLLGAVAVPINYRLSATEVSYILADSGARVLIYGKSLSANIAQIDQSIRSCHDFISCATDKNSVIEGHHHFESMAEYTLIQDIDWPIPGKDSISALVYTSGTTGRPKGVIHTHANDHAIAQNCVMEYSLSPNDKALHIAPLYHVGGMQAYFIPHMMVGGINIVMGKYDAEKTLKHIEKHGVTSLFAVPTQIQEMLFHPKFKTFDISTLKMITTGGSAISSASMERVIKDLCPRIFNGYGMTEASLTLLLRPEDSLAKLGSCGKPTLITECKIVVSDTERNVPSTEIVATGEIGELIVRGPQAMPGYWNKPRETSKKRRGDWIYTGDLFSRDEDGFYYFCGRVDDMIISGGENIYPREVEDVIYHCKGVQEAAVIGIPDEKWGQIVCAYIVSADPTLTEERLNEFCKTSDSIATYKRPRLYRFINKLPTNPSGKVLKRELLANHNKASTENEQ